MPEQELNLFEFSPGLVTSVIEFCAAASPAIALIVSKKMVDRILHAILSLVFATPDWQILVNTCGNELPFGR